MDYNEKWKARQRELWKIKPICPELAQEIAKAGGVRDYMLKFGPFKDIPINEA